MRDDDLIVRIVERIAEREGVDPIELSPPLHDVVDTEALESLFASDAPTGANASVTFTYRGYTVRVDGSGAVHVDESPSETVVRRADG